MKRVLFSCAILCLIAVRPAVGQFLKDIPRPGEREFVQDLAGLISDEHKEEIRSSADKILTETANPIIVVTIEKMTEYTGGREMRIETFAHFLFDRWEIGIVKLDGVDPEKLNRGILLLVSKGDRKARIQLGANWGRRADSHCQKIMDKIIIPRFKRGDFSGGIVTGVRSLEDMIRGKSGINDSLPKREKTLWDYLIIANLIGLGIFTIISLSRRGTNGWAWVSWAAILGIIFFILKAMAAGSGGGGGGYSGGSFGGGSSGGGGASGSW